MMSDRDDLAPGSGANAADADLDALFAAAQRQSPEPLPEALMRRLLADASAAQPAQRPARNSKPSILAALWTGLQDIFVGKQGVAGAVLASCAAFTLGVYSPDTAVDLIGLGSTLELAALELDADPSVLWAEE